MTGSRSLYKDESTELFYHWANAIRSAPGVRRGGSPRRTEPLESSHGEGRLKGAEKSSVRRSLLIAAGIVSVGLATAGVFLPLLPTTPFLLLAAACFIRSSPRLYRWLIHHKWFGSYLRNYWEYRAIPKRTKVIAILLLWGTLFYSAWMIDFLMIRILLMIIGGAVTIHLLRLKNLGAGGQVEKCPEPPPAGKI
jgi:uncharacterized membrane protein YbaN (DUF454 family)